MITGYVNSDQAAELNGMFLSWIDKTHPHLDAEARDRRLREVSCQAIPVNLFDKYKAMLQSWLD